MPTELIEGHVDYLRRPLVRITVAGFSDSLLALVDTGFNGTILIPQSWAKTAGFKIHESETTVEVALAPTQIARMCLGEIEWFDERTEIVMLVEIDDPTQLVLDGEPVISIGTELLANSSLEIDFTKGRVTIRPVV